MVVDCYPYETRTHVTESASDESTKMVTFKDHEEFSFGSWVDVSKKVLPLPSWASVARLKMDESILIGDQETEDDGASETVSPQMNQLRTRGAYPSQIAGCDWSLIAKLCSLSFSVSVWWRKKEEEILQIRTFSVSYSVFYVLRWREPKSLTIVDLFGKCFASLKNISKFIFQFKSFFFDVTNTRNCAHKIQPIRCVFPS